MSWSAFETGRSPPRSDGRLSNLPSKASEDEPPPSNAEPVTAPSRTIVCASSKLVIPTLYPGRRPSATTISTRPSASWPTPVRGLRGASWLEVNASWARNTGPPPRTSTGPPPTAFVIPVHSGRKMRRSVSVVPASARDLDHRAGEVGIRRRGREREDHGLGDARLRRGSGAVRGREERDPVRPRRLVQIVQGAALAEAA